VSVGERYRYDDVGDLVKDLLVAKPEQFDVTNSMTMSYLAGIMPVKPTTEELASLDREINQLLSSSVTERGLLRLLARIFQRQCPEFAAYGNNITEDAQLLESGFNDNPYYHLISLLKVFMLERLHPGDYLPDPADRGYELWRQQVSDSLADTRLFYNGPLGEMNSEKNYGREKTWLNFNAFIKKAAGGENYDSVTVMDVGCGGGKHAIEDFLPNGMKVVLVDRSPNILAAVRRKVAQRGADCRCEEVVMDIGALATDQADAAISLLKNHEPYQAIFADAVLFHVEKKHVFGILAAFYRLLEEKGVLFVNFKINDHSLVSMDGRFFEYYGDRTEIEKWITDVGFEIECVTLTTKHHSMYDSPYTTQWAHFYCSKSESLGL